MRSKVTVVGAGNVGASCAALLAQRELADVVLVDVRQGVARGKALDILQSGPLEGSDVRVTGDDDYGATAGSDVVVLTAGFPRKAGMSREDLLSSNLDVVKATVEEAVRHSPGSILIVVTNPVDAMCHVAYEVSGFPRRRVVGMGGVLDASRFRAFVAQELSVSAEDVTALVLGGHGDTMAPLVRHARVGGIPIVELLDEAAIQRLVRRTREAGTEIVKFLQTRSAHTAPAAAAVQMVEAILKDKKRVLPCSALLEGEYGIRGLFVGVPVKLGAGGVERIFELKLEPGEREALRRSAAAVKELVDLLAPKFEEIRARRILA